jgi:hypothetical protein
MYLPQVTTMVPGDRVLLGLLQGGRSTASSFDVSPSPLATFLFRTVGEEAMMTGLERARQWWRGELTARQFLQGEPRLPVRQLAEAAAQIADTRSGALRALLLLLD